MNKCNNQNNYFYDLAFAEFACASESSKITRDFVLQGVHNWRKNGRGKRIKEAIPSVTRSF